MKVKIKITEDMERVLTLSELPAVESLRRNLSDIWDFKWEAMHIADLACGGRIDVLRFDLEVAKNNRIWNYYSGPDSDDPTYDLDVWIKVMAFDEIKGCYLIGCYLSDIWEVNGKNNEEIRSRMYIRHYALKE